MSCLAHANFDEVGNVCSLSESNKILDDLKVSALERSNDQQRKVASVVRFVTRKLKLKVNETKIAVHRADETEFLGFAFRSRKANVNVTAKNLAKLKQRVRELTARNRGVSFSRMVAELSRYLRGDGVFRTGLSQTDLAVFGRLDSSPRSHVLVEAVADLLLDQPKRRCCWLGSEKLYSAYAFLFFGNRLGRRWFLLLRLRYCWLPRW